MCDESHEIIGKSILSFNFEHFYNKIGGESK
jgi:hypothetical protein